MYQYLFNIIDGQSSKSEVTADMIAEQMTKLSVLPRSKEAVECISLQTWARVIREDASFERPEEADFLVQLIAKAKGVGGRGERSGGKKRRSGAAGEDDSVIEDDDDDDDDDDAVSRKSGAGGGGGATESPGGSSSAVRKRIRQAKQEYSVPQHNAQVKYIFDQLKGGRTIDDVSRCDKHIIAGKIGKQYDTVHGHFKQSRGGCKQCPNWLRHLLGQSLQKGMGSKEFPKNWDDYMSVASESV